MSEYNHITESILGTEGSLEAGWCPVSSPLEPFAAAAAAPRTLGPPLTAPLSSGPHLNHTEELHASQRCGSFWRAAILILARVLVWATI